MKKYEFKEGDFKISVRNDRYAGETISVMNNGFQSTEVSLKSMDQLQKLNNLIQEYIDDNKDT